MIRWWLGSIYFLISAYEDTETAWTSSWGSSMRIWSLGLLWNNKSTSWTTAFMLWVSGNSSLFHLNRNDTSLTSFLHAEMKERKKGKCMFWFCYHMWCKLVAIMWIWDSSWWPSSWSDSKSCYFWYGVDEAWLASGTLSIIVFKFAPGFVLN